MSNPILDGSAFLSSGIDTDEEMFEDELDSEPEEEVEEEEEEIAETAEEDTAVVPEYNDKTLRAAFFDEDAGEGDEEVDHGAAAAAAAKEVEEETTLLNEFKDKIRELRRVVEREDEEDFAQVQSLIGSMPFSQKILSDIEESNLDPDLGAAGQMNESQKKAFYETANAFIAVAKDLFNLKKEALRETKKVLDKDTKLAKKTATGRLTEAEKEGLKAFDAAAAAKDFGEYEVDSALGYANKGLGGAREYTEENKVKQDLKTARIELKRKKRENVNARKRKIEREKAQKKNQSRDGFGLSLEFTEGDKVKSNDSGDIKTYTVEYEDEGKTAKEQWPLVNLIPRDEDPRFDFDMTYKPIFKGFAKELKQSFENRSSTTPTTVKFSLQGTEKIKEEKFKAVQKKLLYIMNKFKNEMFGENGLTFQNFLVISNRTQKTLPFLERSKNYLVFKANRLQEDLLTRLANIDRESGLTANQKSMLQPFRKRVMDAHKITVNKIMSEFMKESEALLTRTDLRYADSDADSDIEEFLVSSDSESEQELDDEEPDPNSAPSSAKRPRLRFAAKVMASAKASVKDVPKAAPKRNLVKKTQVQLRF